MESADILAELETDLTGLSGSDAANRLQSQGRNILIRTSGDSPWRMIWGQFNNPIGWLLIAAGIMSVFLGKYPDAVVVFAAVVINALLGFVQEFQAGKSIA